jgi:putative transposase
MTRTARAARAGVCYHVFTRGNARQTVFHDLADFDFFTNLLIRASAVRPMCAFAWCLMPNHLHLVLRPVADDDLGQWMQWLLTSHVRYHQRRHATVGRIWQGRFKAFPIQQDDHLLTVLRYVERNPVRAGLVDDAARWPWSSAANRRVDTGAPLCSGGFLLPSPVDLPQPWTEWVNQPLTEAELVSIRQCAQRQRPYGDRAWVQGVADRLGLRSTLSPRGRPASTVR